MKIRFFPLLAAMLAASCAPAESQSMPAGFAYPVAKTGGVQFVSSRYGMRQNPQGGGLQQFHTGTDIACRIGTPVVAVADGTIIQVTTNDVVYGKSIILRLDIGVDVLYGHLSELWYAKGRVRRGQTIGLSGNTGQSTGPHLHFQVMMDPDLFLALDPTTLRHVLEDREP